MFTDLMQLDEIKHFRPWSGVGVSISNCSFFNSILKVILVSMIMFLHRR